jgi:predicted O-methyltransferase YrrM
MALGVMLSGRPAPGLAFFGLALLGLVLLESSNLRRTILEAQRQQHALTQIRPLVGEIPLDFSQWAADPLLLQNIVRLVVEHRPGLIVECGSGSSTVIMARCLRALGSGRIISIDHDPVFANRTRELLRLYQVGDLVNVVTAPLAARELNGRVARWYGPEYESLLQVPIDLLVVDGPPGSSGPLARYPAVPLLRRHLAPEHVVVLDDGDRTDERATAQAWRDELDATLIYLDGGRGGWLLRSRAKTAAGS